MNEVEKQLLKRLAEAYAFLSDLHNGAIQIGNTWVIGRTAGLSKSIQQLREEYPGTFQRYMNKALVSARVDVTKKAEESIINGQREETERRQAAAKTQREAEKEEEKEKPKRRSSRPRRQKKKKKAGAKRDRLE